MTRRRSDSKSVEIVVARALGPSNLPFKGTGDERGVRLTSNWKVAYTYANSHYEQIEDGKHKEGTRIRIIYEYILQDRRDWESASSRYSTYPNSRTEVLMKVAS
ncbi:MAG TPA: hypothetical protein VJ574_02745 [Candidatus Bathyarchaeia archaeon]|nr:MAG: hypothetical protein A3K70_03430 [Candidatus Bathyarchaeota archaeon RBG_16_48_13]HJX23313.1 hypothetical protein [Candidatus Bathyarchaeia archaeon]